MIGADNPFKISDDPLLQKEGALSVSNVKKTSFSSIPYKNIKVVSAYLQLIIDTSSNKKEINVLSVIENARNVFEDDYIKATDTYWKEHIAGTLREPFDRGFEANLYNALKFLPKRDGSNDALNFCEKIRSIKDFLNNLAHMKYEDAIKYAKTKNPNCNEITEEVFDEICKDLMDTLFAWFSKHCYKGTN